ncbi:MAG: hypothetical protein ERJ67_06190 [Aphanocapsa feldmannii 277cV]|uniref:Uncharacterized protein n=2 Tax=Aphanocapsa feldmannii TaxID=192050 RepID=A0A524RN66_9CHRO|nr:MAG: hypothetical protein ERJ67_06190 [Aphanocapsa feldmannii 277cV]TGH19655.1 MAG: hypothetical protein ERJ68_08125 [Aphanocapsa feldmannii 277cI]
MTTHPTDLITRVSTQRPDGRGGYGLDRVMRRWFGRNLGLWSSKRRYDFRDGQSCMLEVILRIEAFKDPMKGDACYRFSWFPAAGSQKFFDQNPRYVPSGTMEAYLSGHRLHRSHSYLCGAPVQSRIRQVDEHEVIFQSIYMEWDIIEHIRLVDDDRYRARSIYSWRNSELELVELHHETRLEEDQPAAI